MDDFTQSLLSGRKARGDTPLIANAPPASGSADTHSQDLVEYRILSQRDKLFSGRFDAASLTEVLNRLALEGWRVIAVTSSGVNTLLGGNRDEILIFLERTTRR